MKLVLEVSKKEEELNELNKTIDDLTHQINVNTGKEENENLKLMHQLCENDISDYKGQIKALESNINSNTKILDDLRKENQSLKKNKKPEKDDNKKPLNNIRDISKRFGINLINKLMPSLSKEIKQEIKKEEIPKKILDECLKQKKDYEKTFEELVMKCNNYYNEENKQKKLVEDYMNFINKVNKEIESLGNNFNIKYHNVNLNLNDGKKLLEEICLKVELLSSSLIDLKETYSGVKNFLTFENLLNNIYQNISKIDKKEYYNESILKEFLKEIKKNIEELQNICFLADEQLNQFNNKNALIEKEITEIKKIQKDYKNENIKRNNSIRQSLMQSHHNDDNYIDNNDDQNNDLKNIPITQTILLKPKHSKEELYKTINLFSKEEDVQKAGYAQLYEKNWHEVCYVYDDYDMYDVYFILKAVGLSKNSTFEKGSFSLKSNSTVNLLTVNDKKTEFKKYSYRIEFKINLKNLQTAKIHIKYKHFKNKDYSGKDLAERKLNCYNYYGISSKTNPKLMGKFILILKGNLDIIDFEENFFVKNEKNKNESEYVWGGKVPSEGKETRIRFTRKKAMWNTNIYIKTSSGNNRINSFHYNVKTKFFGGNNNIISLDYSSPQTKNIYLDEENRTFVANYNNNNKFEFKLNLIFENTCKPGWIIELTDEEVESHMPEEDVRDKAKLKVIAKKIIEDFDKKHKNSEFEYYDFMKIAEWVYTNIKYNYSYSGKHQYTALDIYNNKAGVCHHFTRLSNALLYSLGYPVAYIYGHVAENQKFNYEEAHAWSVVRIGNIWVPFDSTWGLFKGKVPITHIFANINLTGLFTYNASSYNNISFDRTITGKLMED